MKANVTTSAIVISARPMRMAANAKASGCEPRVRHAIDQVAGNAATVAGAAKLWRLLAAADQGQRAARMGKRSQSADAMGLGLAGEHDAFLPTGGSGARPERRRRAPACRDEAALGEDVLGVPSSTKAPRYITATRWLTCRTTRRSWLDEEHGEAELGLQVDQQINDLRLDRDVERRDGFIADEEARVSDQRARQDDALPLAAGHNSCG